MWLDKQQTYSSRKPRSHNIEGIPTKTQEAEYAEGNDTVYLSISGNLAAMFVVDITCDRYIKRWTEKLIKKKVCIIVKSIDPFITQKKIASVYGIPQNMVKVIPKHLHNDFDEKISSPQCVHGMYRKIYINDTTYPWYQSNPCFCNNRSYCTDGINIAWFRSFSDAYTFKGI